MRQERPDHTDVEVGFGDIFHADGVRIVAVNDFFDSELGEYVSPRSVHGQLIERDFRGSAAQFASSVRDALVGVPSEQVERTGGHSERFPVGTTAVLDVGAQRYVLVVLARTDVNSLKANAGLAELVHALAEGWKAARNAAGGRSVAVPLLGSGLSGVGLSEQQLATVLLASLIEANGYQQVAPLVRVVLPGTLYGVVDLKALQRTR